MIAILIRHRWLGDAIRRFWQCTPGVPSLYETFDPICFGCRSVIQWDQVQHLERFQDVSNDRIAAEDLGVRLDLKVCELAVERHRLEVWA